MHQHIVIFDKAPEHTMQTLTYGPLQICIQRFGHKSAVLSHKVLQLQVSGQQLRLITNAIKILTSCNDKPLKSRI